MVFGGALLLRAARLSRRLRQVLLPPGL